MRGLLTPGQLVFLVVIDVVLVAVVAFATLPGPARIPIFMALHVLGIVPHLGYFALLNLLVLIVRVAVLWRCYKAGVNDLAAVRYLTGSPSCSSN
jgi:hypothetical protein